MLARVQPPGASRGGNGGVCMKSDRSGVGTTLELGWARALLSGRHTWKAIVVGGCLGLLVTLCVPSPAIARDIIAKTAQEDMVREWMKRVFYELSDNMVWDMGNMVEVCTRDAVYSLRDQDPNFPAVNFTPRLNIFLLDCAHEKGFMTLKERRERLEHQ